MNSSNTPDQMKQLARKWQEGNITDAEKQLFEAWYNSFDPVYEMRGGETREEAEERIYTAILEKGGIAVKKNKTKKLWPRIGMAAAVIGMAIGVYFYTSRHLEGSGAARDLLNYANDIAPGKNTATLSVNGRSMPLSEAKTGVIIDNDDITYNDGSSLAGPNGVARTVTITTPRGGTYQVRLPDGTNVWLNAATSLTYTMPLKERGGIRKVELSGEAYFEVFKNKLQPFVVNSKKLELTVLGTHFNLNTYDDEPGAKATLLEGSVRVASLAPLGRDGRSPERGSVILRPNQQSLITSHSAITVKQVNVNETVAWKNGKFMFNDEPLENIMRNIARWYDVEIEYQGVNPKETFGGSISRFENVSKVLEKLELTGGVHFKIERKKIIVTK